MLELVAIYFAFRAVSGARTPQGAIAWVVFLVTTPYLAVPMFLFLGHSGIRGYIIARRDSEEIISRVESHAQSNPPNTDVMVNGFAAFERIAGMPVVSGNDMELLIDGKAAFDAIFAAMDAAESYLLVQFFILKDDELGKAFKKRLIAQARRGISVRLLYDAVGSSKLPQTYLDELREAGVHLVNAHQLRGPKNRFHLNFRNHRKSVIVDGQVGFTGGLNVGDEYMGRSSKFGDWRDTHVRFTGPVVSQHQLVFVEDWHWATEETLLGELIWQARRAEKNMDALIVATGPGDRMETGSLYFAAAINRANARIWIASPYFVPDNDILTSLKLAAMRGVDVRLLVPEVIDHRITWLAAFAYFDEVMEAGVQVWRYDKGFMHQKVLIVDDAIASVGTMNMDNRSCRLNFETTLLIFDSRAVAEVAIMLEEDFSHAHRLEKELAQLPLSRRIGAPVARLFAPVL
ncbi:MAG: cardiolipin synthase [Hyphomicrobiales bacterium]